jgi:hypothetical protein
MTSRVKQGRRAIGYIAILAIIGARTVCAGINVWSGIGPYGGSARALAIDPQNPGTIYAGTSGGVFKTTDGGTSWNAANACLRDTLPARWLLIHKPRIPYTREVPAVHMDPVGYSKARTGDQTGAR